MDTATQDKNNFEKHHFDKFRHLVMEHTGIKLAESKVDMVFRRFAPRLKKLGLNDFGDYYKLLEENDQDELLQFSNLITTNLTSFFRENHHFDYLKATCLPLVMKRNGASKKIRIWSAGCSSGEEPYSIAMVLRENIPDLDRWDVKILATDLDTTCLDKGRSGAYAEKLLTGVSEQRLKKFFDRERVNQDLVIANAKPELKNLITFNHLNLMHDWPFRGNFDIIFCRNVMIYFDKPTQKVLVEKFSQHQSPGDHLIIGHSENIGTVTTDYKLVGQTVYHRK